MRRSIIDFMYSMTDPASHLREAVRAGDVFKITMFNDDSGEAGANPMQRAPTQAQFGSDVTSGGEAVCTYIV